MAVEAAPAVVKVAALAVGGANPVVVEANSLSDVSSLQHPSSNRKRTPNQDVLFVILQVSLLPLLQSYGILFRSDDLPDKQMVQKHPLPRKVAESATAQVLL